MNQRILIGILALQVILVAAAFLNRLREPEVPEEFLSVQLEDVTAIQITSDQGKVELARREAGGWQLADGNPADDEKVDRVFGDFVGIKGGWPVATSISSAERFEVADDAFQKRVVLTAGDDVLADVYLGSSPGYRSVHARLADSSSVYSIKFSNYELSTDISSWIYKKLLSAEGEVSKISRSDGFSLTKTADTWTSEPAVELDLNEVKSFVDRFADLSIYDINETDVSSIDPINFALVDGSGEYSLKLFHDEENNDWIASSSRVDGMYSISSYVAKQMTAPLDELELASDDEVLATDEASEEEVVEIAE